MGKSVPSVPGWQDGWGWGGECHSCRLWLACPCSTLPWHPAPGGMDRAHVVGGEGLRHLEGQLFGGSGIRNQGHVVQTVYISFSFLISDTSSP